MLGFATHSEVQGHMHIGAEEGWPLASSIQCAWTVAEALLVSWWPHPASPHLA
jgi:hypothetical protein